MFYYQPNLLSQTYPCTSEVFTQIVTSTATVQTIEKIREAPHSAPKAPHSAPEGATIDPAIKDPAKHANEAPSGAVGGAGAVSRLKKSLPGFLFQATFVETTSAKGRKGRWRKQSAAVLNGLYMCDFDHVADPRATFRRWVTGDGCEVADAEQMLQAKERFAAKYGILLVFVTPSGHGLKVVAKADTVRGNLWDNQLWLAQELGMKADEGCKDASRLAFAPTLTDILFIDKEQLFDYDNPEFDKAYGDEYRKGNSAPVRSANMFDSHSAAADGPAHRAATGGVDGGAPADGTGQGAENATEGGADAELMIETNEDGKYCFKSVPYETIEAAYWAANGGEPATGERHNRMLRFFGRMRYICDNNPQMVIRVVNHRGLGMPELRNLADSACGKQLYQTVPKDFRAILESVGVQTLVPQSSSEVMEQPQIDYQYWWKRLSPLLVPGFNEAVAGVPDNVKMGAVLAAGAMFGTYMTRCWFTHYDGKELRLSFIVYIVGDAASGKSFIIDLDREIMACMKQADKPGREWERQYKEDKQKRATSSKAQKSDAQDIKHPVVRYVPSTISNAKLYARLTDAYDEQCDMHLHLYTLESELATALRVQTGSWAGKLDLELKSFQNEEAGVDYANEQSVNGLIQVNWNQVISGTMDAMQRKVKPANILDGYATRLAVFLMPSQDFAALDLKQARRGHADREALKQWGYRLDGLSGELTAKPLVEAAYEWVEQRRKEAEFNDDKILDYFRKRVPIYMVRYGLVHAVLSDYDHYRQTGKLRITQKSIRFAQLIGDFVLYMQMYMFGRQVQDAQLRVQQNFEPMERKKKTMELYNHLPKTFTLEDLMNMGAFSVKASATNRAIRWMKDGLIKRVRNGQYEKIIDKI